MPAKSLGQNTWINKVDSLYIHLELQDELDFDIFFRAFEGMQKYEFKKTNLLTIIDYTRASKERRLFIIDLEKQEILYHILVAHGKNSGEQYAEEFSNKNRSLMSSPGFYRTAETYHGKHGYSLKLDGLEEGINDHARDRLIVIHGAHYVSDNFILKHGRLGRSWGCPALPVELTKEVIDLIKEGSCLYIHTDDESYLKDSSL
jgi:hypothetical protein